jgi:hypothetical protein
MPRQLSGYRANDVGEAAARVLLQIELKRRDLTYRDLTEMLNQFGINENERNLRNKIARGTFSASFFVICLMAMGVKSLAIEGVDDTYLDKLRSEKSDAGGTGG